MIYAEKLKDPRWQKKRLQILERDNWQCQKCGDGESTLNIHHIQYNGNPWEANDDKLITVCEDCHTEIERLKGKQIEFNKIQIVKKVTSEKQVKVLFISCPGIFRILIKDDHRKFISGFNLSNDTANDILQLINKSYGDI